MSVLRETPCNQGCNHGLSGTPKVPFRQGLDIFDYMPTRQEIT